MALIHKYYLPGGIVLDSAYSKIERINFYTPKEYETVTVEMVVEVATYKDAETRGDTVNCPVVIRAFNITPPADRLGNLYEQAYTALKALPEFEGATNA